MNIPLSLLEGVAALQHPHPVLDTGVAAEFVLDAAVPAVLPSISLPAIVDAFVGETKGAVA